VTADLPNQNFTTTLNSHTVSGTLGTPDATVAYTGAVSGTALVSGSSYSFSVPDGWTGSITPSPTKASHIFSPLSITISTPITADLPNQDFAVSAQATFADVPTDYWSWQFIETLYANGVTSGCGASPLTYCPDSPVTRAQMAVFLLRGEHGSSYLPPAVVGTRFTDVDDNYWAADWIEQLAAEGITGGCAPGQYCPDSPVTRAQMAVFLLRGEHGSSYAPPAGSGARFTDVPADYWSMSWIEQLASENVTGGCAPGKYCPDNGVTRAEMAVFLVRTFNLH
jgi:hypothetical protein